MGKHKAGGLGKGEIIGILCDTKETIWILASTKENGELIDLNGTNPFK